MTLYLNLKRRLSIMLPIELPREQVMDVLEQIKEARVEYPAELLKATRENFITQVEKSLAALQCDQAVHRTD